MPQPRGLVPPDIAERLAIVSRQRGELEEEENALILEALAQGASFREIGKVLGVDGAAVQKRAKRRGWPPPWVLEEREAKAAELKVWRDRIDAIREGRLDP